MTANCALELDLTVIRWLALLEVTAGRQQRFEIFIIILRITTLSRQKRNCVYYLVGAQPV